MDFEGICADLRAGAEKLSQQTAAQKNRALEAVAASIGSSRNILLAANARDVERAEANGMQAALVERLSLDEKKIDGILDSMRVVINQEDPVGEETAGWTAPNGMQIRQVRVPLGVVAIIYESRPNVTVDAFCLAYKSGNAILLRGSSSALESNKALVKCIKEGLHAAGSSGVPGAIELSESTGHEDVQQILTAVGKIDVVIPRGGKKLIQTVVQNARVPVIETGSGVCHLYVDDAADLQMAVVIAENAKIQRPGACNAVECILVNKRIASDFLPMLEKKFAGRVQMRADEICLPVLKAAAEKDSASAAVQDGGKYGQDCVVPAETGDYGYEFLDYICSVHAVGSVDEAVAFINAHNTKHSECIVTNDRAHARQFQTQVDAACVYVNSSTRFTDGGEFGFGAELGISTQKLHARGPMGIKALTTTKYLIDGEGQIR
ncbi:MAG TPA: glutamate-5-semialdehyde dehydrogenase [Treponema sp.]|nr:glutamate-5-semialdehyde dehydrogenase [Treponema sp.]